MTEAEWLASDDPVAMLADLNCDAPTGNVGRGQQKMSDRKLRLFAAACAWNVAATARSYSNVDNFIRNSEEWAETGQAPPGVREASDPVDIHDEAIDHARGAAYWARLHRGGRTPQELMAAQAALLRDITGNPWRPVTLPLKPHWSNVYGAGTTCPWLTPTVLSLAQAAYDERCDDGTLDPVRLAILADALEEAGCPPEMETTQVVRYIVWGTPDGWCVQQSGSSLRAETALYRNNRQRKVVEWVTEQLGATNWQSYSKTMAAEGKVIRRLPHPLLAHLRSPGPHVRGDWAVDLVLGKE